MATFFEVTVAGRDRGALSIVLNDDAFLSRAIDNRAHAVNQQCQLPTHGMISGCRQDMAETLREFPYFIGGHGRCTITASRVIVTVER